MFSASLDHNCDVVSLGGEDSSVAADLLAEWIPGAKLRAIFSPHIGWRLVFARIMSLLKGEPIFFARYASSKVRTLTSSIIEEGYDLVVIESFALVNYGANAHRVPCVISITDAVSAIYAHAIKESNSFIFGLYRRYQCMLVKRSEMTLLRNYAAIHVVSDYDRQYLLREYDGLEVFVTSHVLPGHVLASFKNSADLVNKETSKINIIYSGRVSDNTALNSLHSFVDQVYKPLINSGIDIQLTILTGGAEKKLTKSLEELDSVVVKNWVENYELELLNSDILVFADTFLNGVKTRLLYALAAGKPIVATPASVFGLPVIDAEHMFIREIGPEFSEAIKALIDDKALSRRLGLSGLNLLEQELSTEAHNRKWASFFKEYSN